MEDKRIRVLLIEDDPGDADLLREALSDQKNPSFEIEHVGTVRAGLEYLSKKESDVIVSDLTVPDSQGLETFLKVHAQAPTLPIVILSGFDDGGSLALEAVRRGAQDYLVKGQVDGRFISRILRYAIERKRVEKELAHLASFAELNPNPIIEADGNGKVTYLNPVARARFSDLDELGLKHPLLADLKWVIGKLQEGNQKSFVREVAIGEQVYEQHLSYLPGKDVIRSYLLDITERKRVDQLKDDFVSTVSHELRTPLSIVKQGLSLLLDKIPGSLGEKQEKILTIAKDNIDRLARIINSLLDVSKIESGRVGLRRERLDIAHLIQQVAETFQVKMAEKTLELKVEVPQEGCGVYADADKITQVFTNLVGNAMKFTQEGYIKISAAEKGNEVECTVADTGIGISKENLPKVFDRFQQFGRTAGGGEKGTGLGLAIAKGLVELHYGTIRFQSTLGKGTQFIFTLPKYTVENVLKVLVKDGIKEMQERDSKMSLILLTFSQGQTSWQGLFPEGLPGFIEWTQGILKNGLCRQGDVVIQAPNGLAMLLAGCDKKDAQGVRMRLEEAFKEYRAKGNLSPSVTFRFGCATYPEDAKDDEGLIQVANREEGGVHAPKDSHH